MATISSQGLAFIKYSANGSETIFQFFFPFLEPEHIKVYVDGVLQINYILNEITGEVILNTPPNIGQIVFIRRETPNDAPLVRFVNQSSLNKEDLNKNDTQVLYVMQEVLDEILEGGTQLENLDMNNFRIINLSNGVDSKDAVNLGQVQELINKVSVGVAIKEEEIVAIAGQTEFTLTTFDYTPGYGVLSIYVDGIAQAQTDYMESSKTTIIFDEAMNGGERVVIRKNDSVGNNVNIQQADFETLGGVVLATDQEAEDGTNRLKAITPASLKYVLQRFLPQDATTEQKGVVQLAALGDSSSNNKASTPETTANQINTTINNKFIISSVVPDDGDGNPDGTIVFVLGPINIPI